MIPYSQLRDPNRLPLARLLPLDRPLSVFVEVTTRCNFRCGFCPQALPDFGERVDMPIDLYRRVVSGLAGTQVIRLYGTGEPILHPEILEMVTLAHQTGARVELVTNGSALTASRSLGLVNAGLDYLKVSVYGVSQETFTATTGGAKMPHDTILRNVKAFVTMRGNREKPHLTVKMIAAQAELEEFKKIYTGIADEVMIEVAHDWSGEDGLLQIGEPATKKKVCPLPFYSMFVCVDGSVRACCIDWRNRTNVGGGGDMKQGWENLETIRQLQREGRRETNLGCRGCRYPDTNCSDDLDGHFGLA